MEKRNSGRKPLCARIHWIDREKRRSSVKEQSRNGRPVPASARGGPCTPEPRRYSHPIERRREGQCEPVQSILCALAGQNQVLCAMKAELDEILALLEQQAETAGGDCCQ